MSLDLSPRVSRPNNRMTDTDFKEQLRSITSAKPLLAWSRHIPAKYPILTTWIIEETARYAPISLTESIYIILNGAPVLCNLGNKPKFISYSIGYQQFCKHGCACFKKDASIKAAESYKNLTIDQRINREAKIRNTNIEKYGHTRPSASVAIIEKIKETNLRRYGHTSYIGSKMYQDGCIKKYGGDQHLCVLKLVDQYLNGDRINLSQIRSSMEDR